MRLSWGRAREGDSSLSQEESRFFPRPPPEGGGGRGRFFIRLRCSVPAHLPCAGTGNPCGFLGGECERGILPFRKKKAAFSRVLRPKGGRRARVFFLFGSAAPFRRVLRAPEQETHAVFLGESVRGGILSPERIFPLARRKPLLSRVLRPKGAAGAGVSLFGCAAPFRRALRAPEQETHAAFLGESARGGILSPERIFPLAKKKTPPVPKAAFLGMGSGEGVFFLLKEGPFPRKKRFPHEGICTVYNELSFPKMRG